jgi:predicted NBD/HSP70 family sugar kinase
VDYLDVSINIRNKPTLDPDFMPLHLFNQAFLRTAGKPVAFAVENSTGLVSVCRTRIHGTPGRAEADAYYMDRLVKTLLWQKGGYKLMVCGDRRAFEMIAAAYRPGGARAFDADYMQRFFERPFETVCLEYGQCPAERYASRPVGRHLDGCRIGFDAGGSDWKVSAVIDGEPVFGEEVIWLPKENANPDYHFKGIIDGFKTAAAHMPRVDGIGVSSAGVYVGNRTMAASLFLKVPQDLFESKVKDIYIRAAREIGPDIPVEVCNDGDVSALAGAMSLGSGCVLGLAMGTSEAGGYVDKDGFITGWLNELAFVPVDANPDAMADEWSGDIGCGGKYFSQDGVIKLAIRAGIDLSADSTPADKLKTIQKLMAADDPRAVQVYQDIGCCLGHTLAWYDSLYEIKHVLLLGRVMSGKGGDLVLSRAKEILADEYPAVRLTPSLPDEKYRRIGQSVAAASLPDIKKGW